MRRFPEVASVGTCCSLIKWFSRGGGVLPSAPQQSRKTFFPLLFLFLFFFFFLIIVLSRTKELSWNGKACGCTEGRRRAAACQGKGAERGGIPSIPWLLTPAASSWQTLFLWKSRYCRVTRVHLLLHRPGCSETAVAGGKGN